jgi:hypothetical protein
MGRHMIVLIGILVVLAACSSPRPASVTPSASSSSCASGVIADIRNGRSGDVEVVHGQRVIGHAAGRGQTSLRLPPGVSSVSLRDPNTKEVVFPSRRANRQPGNSSIISVSYRCDH